MEHNLRDIIVNRGIPFTMLRIYPRGTTCREYIKHVKDRVRDAKTLGEFIIPIIHDPYTLDVRIGTSFDPDHWYEPETWSQYGYPVKTLFREKLGDKEIDVREVDDHNTRMFYAYNGIGVVCSEFTYSNQYMETAKPILYIFIKPYIPRKTIVWEEYPPLTIHAYTGLEEIGAFLLQHGFTAVKPYEYVKKYTSEDEMLDELYRLDEHIRHSYDVVETYMLRGLRRRVKRRAKTHT